MSVLDEPTPVDPVKKLMDTADQITARTLAIEEIREAHRPHRYSNPGAPETDCCHQCSCLAAPRYVSYPCETAAILERHGLT